jgi:hypothetical protein
MFAHIHALHIQLGLLGDLALGPDLVQLFLVLLLMLWLH